MEKLEDSYKARGLRKQLVKEIVEKGITDTSVIEAIGRIPRHLFLESIFITHAYEDKAFPIGQGQTISQPYTVAFQSQLLDVKQGNRILEIGTGSGYQAAVLVELGAEVYTIEYNEQLYLKTKKFLPKLGYTPHFYHGDGSLGLPAHAPYDGILVTAGAPSVPKALVQQLATGGKLIIPVGDQQSQQMLLIEKTAANKLIKKEYNEFSFVPLLGKEGWKK